MTRLPALLPAILLVTALPAAAQSVGDCGEWVSAANIVEPWEENAASYANGEVRLAQLDTIEPAGAPVHLLILSPPYGEGQERQCRTVSLVGAPEGGWPSGFWSMDFPARTSSYDPATGLTVVIPVKTFVPETGDGAPARLTVTINQATGQIGAKLSE